jgi:hypothetical protein
MSEDFEVVKHGKWCPEEDEFLRVAVSHYGEKHWRQISLNVPGRTPIQCLHRWSKILKPGLVKGPWSAHEDKILRDWVDREGPTKWSQCSTLIPGRSGKQCRERWFNILNPHVKKGDWKNEEDALIFQMYQNLGPRWTLIAKQLPGRTENSIKNRFYSTVRKMKQHSKYEDEQQGETDSVAKVEDTSYEETADQRMMNLLQQVQQLEHLLHHTRREILFLESSLEGGEDNLPIKPLAVKSEGGFRGERKI